MKDYNNWPSREAVIKNKISYHEQQSSIERLSPCTKQDFSKTDTGFFKDKKLMGLPKVRNHDHGDQIFKKEMKNSQLKNAAKYSEENIQIR